VTCDESRIMIMYGKCVDKTLASRDRLENENEGPAAEMRLTGSHNKIYSSASSFRDSQ
jgi:hypothetical protein